MKSVVVIGSNSFSGCDFIDLLLESGGYTVTGVSRSARKGAPFVTDYLRPERAGFTFHRLDLNRNMPDVCELLSQLKPEYVVNFASQSEVAPSWESPEQWFRTNAVAVAELANFLRKQPWLKRYVHISTPEVYGSCSGHVAEDARFNPTTPYAASRAAGEFILTALARQYGFPLVVIRSANVYGARQQLHKIIPRTFVYLRQGRVLPLHGGGTQTRSFIHIRDISHGELAAMETAPMGAVYNLAPEDSVSIRDLVALICESVGADFTRSTKVVGERPGQDAAYLLDCNKAKRELNWRASISLHRGLDEVSNWINSEWALIEREPVEYEHKP